MQNIDDRPYDERLAEAEDDHAVEIDIHRRRLHSALANLDSAITTVHQTTRHLMSDQVYDVELVEGRAAVIVPYAIAQIEVALAALRSVAPAPGA